MTVELSLRDDVALITLNRPEALNALSFEIIREIETVIDKVALSGARAILFIGEGTKAFCAGADIKELRGRTLVQQKQGSELGQSVFSKISAAPMPSIALINGYAFGGGLEMALACDFRIASTHAKMGLPEIKLGLIPGYGGTQRLPRIIGEARALEMIMTAETVDAAEAKRIGLVNLIADGNLLKAGIAFAQRMTGFSLPALGFARTAIRRAVETPLPEGLKCEAELSTLSYQLADAEEGMLAFEEKRKPEFKDA